MSTTRERVLVDADWVEAHLDDPTVVLVEVDEDTAAYEKNHLRGAVRIDWKQDLHRDTLSLIDRGIERAQSSDHRPCPFNRLLLNTFIDRRCH